MSVASIFGSSGVGIALSMLFATAAVAKKDLQLAGHSARHEVLHVTGPVVVWHPWSDRWTPVVQGRTLPEGAIIQVGSGGSATIRPPKPSDGKRNTNFGADRALITLKSPMILRLDGHIVRNMNLDPLFLNQFTSAEAPPEPVAAGLLGLFEDAWSRTLAMITAAPKSIDLTKPEALDQNQGSSLSLQSKPIEIVSPVDKSFLIANAMPQAIGVRWLATPNTSQKYAVYIWRQGDTRSPAYDQTTLLRYELPVTEFGEYFVQVTSIDQTFSSPVHAVTVAPRDALPYAKHKPTLLPMSPPDGMTFMAGSAKIQFSWVDEGGTSENYILHLDTFAIDGSKDTRHIAVASAKFFTVDLPPGRYEWHVASARTAGDATSETRQFFVLKRPQNLTSLLTNIIGSTDDRVILLNANERVGH